MAEVVDRPVGVKEINVILVGEEPDP